MMMIFDEEEEEQALCLIISLVPFRLRWSHLISSRPDPVLPEVERHQLTHR